MKKLLLFLVILIIIILIAGGGLLYFFIEYSKPVSNSPSPEEVFFTIKSGENLKTIAENLENQKIIKNALVFELSSYFDSSQKKLIAGDYILKRNYNVKEIMNVLTSGIVSNERIIRIIEGWTANEIGDYFEKEGIVSKEVFLSKVDATDSRKIIVNKTYTFLSDKPLDNNLEGYLFPDTYSIYKNSTPAQIIEKMLDNFDSKLTQKMREDIKAKNQTVYNIVILASIIEKEVRTDQDRKIASGVFWKRMANNIPLQSDATVNYATGKHELQPSSEDLETASPYNTYKNKGLPPGPICNPSLSAIGAAIYPEDTDYLYFLTKPDGTTVFSKTYEEHLENKEKYLK